MNAIKFIKQNGIEKAREVVVGAPDGAELFHTNTYLKNAHSEGKTDHFARWSDGFSDWINASADRNFIDSSIDLLELKRLIESVALVNSLGGVQEATNKAFDMTMLVVGFNSDKIEHAIADYESIYGGEHV